MPHTFGTICRVLQIHDIGAESRLARRRRVELMQQIEIARHIHAAIGDEQRIRARHRLHARALVALLWRSCGAWHICVTFWGARGLGGSINGKIYSHILECEGFGVMRIPINLDLSQSSIGRAYA